MPVTKFTRLELIKFAWVDPEFEEVEPILRTAVFDFKVLWREYEQVRNLLKEVQDQGWSLLRHERADELLNRYREELR